MVLRSFLFLSRHKANSRNIHGVILLKGSAPFCFYGSAGGGGDSVLCPQKWLSVGHCVRYQFPEQLSEVLPSSHSTALRPPPCLDPSVRKQLLASQAHARLCRGVSLRGEGLWKRCELDLVVMFNWCNFPCSWFFARCSAALTNLLGRRQEGSWDSSGWESGSPAALIYVKYSYLCCLCVWLAITAGLSYICAEARLPVEPYW